MWLDIDIAVTVFVNILQLTDDTDFKTIEEAIAYDAAGMDLNWNFQTTGGIISQINVTPTTGGIYDWTHVGNGMYKMEIPASGGGSINNDAEGFGFFSGFVTGILPFRGPTYGFRAVVLNNSLINGGAFLPVNMTQLANGTQSAADLRDFADGGYDPITNKVQGVVLVDTTTTNTDMVTEPPTAVQNREEMDSNSTELAKIGTIPALDGAGQTIGAAFAKLADDNAGADFDATTDSLQAIRDRGDAAWITGGGGGITDIINIQPLIPFSIDLANTVTYRFGLMLINSLNDLPSTAEITPGTISIDRKAIGGTSWSSIVSDAAMLEIAGLVYYDEVLDNGSGYVEGDSIRVTIKNVKVTVAANDYEIIGATGRIFYTSIRQTMIGTDNAALASALSTHDGKLDTAQTDLDTLTGADGATLATNQGNYAPSKAGDLMGLADDAITPSKYNNPAAVIPYQGGIWVDSAASNTNTVVGVDGLPSNPVSTLIAARTLADAIGLKKYFITNGSALTLAATHESWEFVGLDRSSILNLGSQDLDNSVFINLSLAGTQGGTGFIKLDRCTLTSLLSLRPWAVSCCIAGNITILTGAMLTFDQCFSGVPGSGTPELTFTAGVTTLNFRHYSGGLEVKSMTSDHTMSFETDGQLIVNSNCTSGIIVARGNMSITDNGTTMDITKDAVWNTSQGVQSVSDDVGITQAGADKVFGPSGATIPEPSAGVPPATPKPQEVFGWLWAHFRNKGTLNKTTGEAKVYNDAGSVIAKGIDTDDGTTFTKGELGTP